MSDSPSSPSMAGSSPAEPAGMMAGSLARHRNGALGVVAVPDPATDEPVPFGLEVATAAPRATRPDRYRVSVREYVTFREQGFLVVRGLVSRPEVAELVAHTEDLLYGRVTVPGLEPPPPGASVAEIERRYLRIHMLHRHLPIHERFLLHPRILDVLEALIGPDLMAMQTMLFIKPPGGDGQGYHQDSYYIPTYPDSLCGAWLAIDRADEENGCLWMTPGSQHEPIYPSADRLHQNHGDALADLAIVDQVSNTDEAVNGLTPIAAKYAGREVPVPADPGDVVFFGGHILHRSHRNYSAARFRRAFVGHYANARSFTMWGKRGSPDGTNHLHILARGRTHLPYGQPRFGTPCAANQPAEQHLDGGAPMDMMPDGDMLEPTPMDMARNDPESHDH